MPLQKELARKIARDAIISIFIYALPVALMLLSFYISGERPWEKKARAGAVASAPVVHPKISMP